MRAPTTGTGPIANPNKRAPEDDEGRSLRGHAELLGRSSYCGPCLARLEGVVDRDRNDRVAEEVERGSLTQTVGQAPRPHLAGTERGTQVAWKERCTCGTWPSGSDRRRTGDQLRR